MRWLRFFIASALFALVESGAKRHQHVVAARDGHGNPVAWWAVLKLPMRVRTDGSAHPVPTPCDCQPPRCDNVATKSRDFTDRATGLCYLYADSNNPSFRYFRDLAYDCLGQGGNDPVSQTLRGSVSVDASNSTSWAIFNDQLNGIADAERARPHSSGKDVCSGQDIFSAHAKGAIAFNLKTGGFVLQTSTPNYPDPSQVTPSSQLNDSFVRLGCQVDNNLEYAQHMFAMSMDMETMNDFGAHVQAARLCSGNFYRDKRDQLASEWFRTNGKNDSRVQQLFDALLDPNLPFRENSTVFTFPVKDYPSQALLDTSYEQNNVDPVMITAIIKSPSAAVPPWALAAEVLQMDMSVASWWDGSYGIPNICAGDVYTNATNHFCLQDERHGVALNANGAAKHNVENLIEAFWSIGLERKLHWHLIGGSHPDGNHAKWGISSPRNASAPYKQYVVFADLNMEGYPCSTRCDGSQGGRGGSFFVMQNPRLHDSFVNSVISRACSCRPPTFQSHLVRHTVTDNGTAFERLRMCHMGCWRRLSQRLKPSELPILSPDASSYWPVSIDGSAWHLDSSDQTQIQ